MKHLLLTASSLFLFIGFLFSQSGTPDNTFGVNGIATASVALLPADNGYSTGKVVQLPNGKYITSVYSYEFDDVNSIHLYLYRFNQDGKVDSSFGTSGKVAIFPNKPTPEISALAADANNRILFTLSDAIADPASDATIARLKQDGSFDSSFGNNGVLALHTTAYNTAMGDALTVLPDGNILAACYGESNKPGGAIKCVLFKLTTKGALNKSFNGTGYASFSPVATGGGGGDAFTSSRPLALQPDGGILVSYIDIVRFRADGSRDMSFGTNGFITPKLSNSHIENFHNLAACSDGSFLVSGSNVTYGNDGGNATQNVYKYTQSGMLDPTFATGGTLTLHNNERFFETPPASGDINVQADNKFLLIDIPPTGEFSHTDKITRFLPNGKVDSSFAVNGSIVAPMVGGTTLLTSDLFLQADSKILALRSPFLSGTTGNGDFYLYRYNNIASSPVAGNNAETGSTAIIGATKNTLTAAASVVIFPNPVTDKITITGLEASKTSQVAIYDMQGKALSKTQVSSARVSLSVASYKAGVYVLVITQNNNTTIKQTFLKK